MLAAVRGFPILRCRDVAAQLRRPAILLPNQRHERTILKSYHSLAMDAAFASLSIFLPSPILRLPDPLNRPLGTRQDYVSKLSENGCLAARQVAHRRARLHSRGREIHSVSKRATLLGEKACFGGQGQAYSGKVPCVFARHFWRYMNLA